MSSLWYVCYGSNMDESRFRKYLAPNRPGPLEHEWVECSYERYYAGNSKTWGGPVAFLALEASTAARTRAKAYRISPAELSRIARRENGADIELLDAREVLEVGQWTALPAQLSPDGFRGKYNALLRLEDIGGERAYTLTTARRLPIGSPTKEYLSLVHGALGEPVPSVTIHSEQSTNTPFISSAWEIHFRWEEANLAGRNTGFDAIRLPTTYAPAHRFPALLGELETEFDRAPTWLIFSNDVEEGPLVDPSLAESAGLDAQARGTHVRLDVVRPVARTRLSARASDIPPNDVIQVHASDAAALGKWTLVMSPTLAAPFRVMARPHVPEGSVRLGYASRRLLGIGDDDEIWIQRVMPPQRRRRRIFGGLGEFLVGAPVVALRSTEGLVGDDGSMIVRVDPTALDLLGIVSGDRVIVSWGWRSIDATALLQTDSTIATMRDQLSENTGAMARQSVGDIPDRLAVPEHLRVWVSTRIRHELHIPPDTIVRLRRSVQHTMLKHAFALSLPAAGFLLAALALTHIPPVYLGALALGVLVATFAAIRRRERAQRNPARRNGRRR